ncbi:GIY-YIG nuclease family protein [Desulfurobacterium sp.]
MNVKFPDSKGTYIIVFSLQKERLIRTKSKSFMLSDGIYSYVGSAFGAGGLKSRLKRHLNRRKKKHWHLDYVSSSRFFKPLAVYCFPGKRIECYIADRFEKVCENVPQFGCSDCSCKSHLFIVNSVSKVDKIIFDLPFLSFNLWG